MKTRLLIALMFTFAVGQVHAAPYQYGNPGYYPPLPNYQQETPADLLQDGIERLQAFIEQKGINDPEVLTAFLNEQIAPFFDFDRMAQMVGGRYYLQLSPTERALFKNRLKTMFFSALGRNLGAYTNPKPRVDFMRPRQRGYNEIEVAARIMPANGYPVRLVFKFANSNEGWKVYDVSSNGQSAVLYYRKYVLEQIRRYGPRALLN